MYFQGPHLRVSTPVTSNGIIPKMEGGQIAYRIDFLPMSAKAALEKKNQRLVKAGQGHLQMKIEIVSDQVVEVPPAPVGPDTAIGKTRKIKDDVLR